MKGFIDDVNQKSGDYGSLPFWSWNDRLDEEELRRQMRVMKDIGMNGFFMHARGGLETEYLSDEWYSCINACIDEAKKLGMDTSHQWRVVLDAYTGDVLETCLASPNENTPQGAAAVN